MRSLYLSLILLSIASYGTRSYSQDINILNEGANPGGMVFNTDIIQTSINLVSERGGGVVIIPPGVFLTGSLILKNGVTLEVMKGATLLGSRELKDYLSIKPEFVALRTGVATKQLIFAEGQSNIGIKGEGIIDGQGEAFIPASEGDEPGITRPHLIQLINCRNVRISGISMRNSGGWMQHYLACENLEITGINIYNHCNYNNDGIDIDGCSDVVISNCIVDSDDDGICLKSTSPKSCKNVLVTGCIVKSHCNALKMGTESTGGFRNISISNCIVSPSADPDPIYGTINGQSAISVEMVDGGLLDGVNISNITISETDCPIFIRLGNRARKYTRNTPEPGIGTLQNVTISNVVAATSSKCTSNITGIPGAYAENIMLNNILITNLSTGNLESAKIKVPESDKKYPSADMFGKLLPASGFFVRHVKNISFNNVNLIVSKEEQRPLFVLNDVKGSIINITNVLSLKKGLELVSADTECKDIKIIR